MPSPAELDIAHLSAGYRAGAFGPRHVVDAILARNAALADPAIWIVAPDPERLTARVTELEAMGEAERSAKPLWGIPFAVKDNIDVAGLPTTAACPAYSYVPEHHAVSVERLLAAGAILVGKTNLDQFATGLVGVRSPYGTPRNSYDARYVPGGSSSGSAVAVARGLASFAFGTDTAGSGRVPAGFNNLVGLKPSRGIISTEGVVPACRSLDCVSIFARSVADAEIAFASARGTSAGDPFSRHYAPKGLPAWPNLRVGVPASPTFHGDRGYETLFAAAIDRARLLGATVLPIDFTPFEEVAQLLYGGPWVAERYAAVGHFIDAHPEAVHPTTRAIISAGRNVSAASLFEGLYRLEALRKESAPTWDAVDVLMVPTAPTIPTLADLEADPIGPNSRCGTYTNFVNLLDLAALAMPAGFREDGLPFGVTFVAPAMTDGALAALGRDWTSLIEIAVVGAHLQGQPLHHELGGAPLVRRTRTAANYRLYALPGTEPPKPGLVRGRDGAEIEVEVYALDAQRFGRFVAEVPPPLAIGTVNLVDGTTVKGFVCEPAAVDGALDITSYGGWRAYRSVA